ncbi:SDR family NAD(P)-dependent oxidoreductase [Trichococcus sp.]|uniref:SDR family NAD(P)-dependent oxidoreductase n=1 Tax=Trichococcus sp. TaxID=1985464 RepID=UPI003C7A7987
MNSDSFKDKIVLITGGGQGIGKGIALTLAKEGASLAIIGRNLAALEETQKEIRNLGGECHCFQGDISEEQACQEIVGKVVDTYGRIDVLINNAGIMKRESTLDTSNDDWRSVIDVNLNGVFYLSKLVLAGMKERKTGNIINITSANGVTPHSNAAPSYGASKAAVTYLTRHFAMEFAGDGIRVNAIQCGPIESKMTDQWSDEYRQKSLGNIPLARLGTAQDVAAAALFLASEEAAFITGTSLNLSGGKLMQ